MQVAFAFISYRLDNPAYIYRNARSERYNPLHSSLYIHTRMHIHKRLYQHMHIEKIRLQNQID